MMSYAAAFWAVLTALLPVLLVLVSLVLVALVLDSLSTEDKW